LEDRGLRDTEKDGQSQKETVSERGWKNEEFTERERK
jgi:hypothetical protein